MADVDDWVTPAAPAPAPAPAGGMTEWNMRNAQIVAPHPVPGGDASHLTDLSDEDYARMQAQDRGEKVMVPIARPAPAPAENTPPAAAGAAPAPAPVDDWITPTHPAPKPTEGGSGVGRGLIEGASALIGLPGDVAHLADRGYEWALTKTLEKLGAITPEAGAGMRKPIEGLDAEPTGSAAVTKHLMDIAESLGANTNAPETKAGKYAETVASFLPGAIAGTAPSSLGQAVTNSVKYALLPGAASEMAGEAVQGKPIEPYVRAGTAMLAGAPFAVSGMFRSAAGPIGEALRDVTPAQFNEAQALLDQSRAAGVPLTVPEALQQVTNSGTRLGDIQRVVEQSDKGAAIMRPFYAQRPAQTEQLGKQMLGQVAPPITEPTELAPRVQHAALGPEQGAPPESARGVEQFRTAASSPYYQAAATDQVPASEVENILQRIDSTIAADKTGILEKSLAPIRDALTERPAVPASPGVPAQPRVPVTDIANLDRARQYFRDQVNLPDIAAASIPKQVANNVNGILSDLRSAMEAASPKFATGRLVHQQVSESHVLPVQRSPIGQLAQTEKLGKQMGVLFQSNPLPGSEAAVARAVRVMAQTDPVAAQQLVRIHLERTLNEALQSNVGGPNQWGGPKFAAVAAGNAQQLKNVEAALGALPGGPARLGAFRNALKIMQAQGTRQHVGSQTEFNKLINESLRGGTPLTELAGTSTNPLDLARKAQKIYEDFKFGKNTATLARLFTEGNVNDLRALAVVPAGSLRAQAVLIGSLARLGAMQPGNVHASGNPQSRRAAP